MPISFAGLSGGASASGENFTLDVGASGNTTYTFDTDLAAGQYSIASQSNDTSLEIYLVASDDTSAGFTSTSSVTATKPFNRVVVYGSTNNDSLTFTYRKSASPTASGNVNGGVPPFITSIATSSLPNAGSTTVVTGGNFASNVAVTFIAQGGATFAGTVTRTSSTSLIVARPVGMLTSASPFSIKVSNPGFTDSTLRAHTLSNAITVGTGPSWNTDATLPIYALNSAYSTTLSATDPDAGGSVAYSIASGALPTGLSLNGSTGVISGTPTADAASTTVTIRATDAGGNFSDRAFKLAKVLTITGGTLYTDSTHSYRRFTSTGTLYVGGGSLSYTALLVGGGGGGGGTEWVSGTNWSGGGGGGGGGVLEVSTTKTLAAGNHTVAVGGGGGGQSRIGTASDIAYGGGGGGSGVGPGAGGNGASGGGGGSRFTPSPNNGAAGLAIYGAQGTNGFTGGSGTGGSGGGLNTTVYNTNWLQKVAGPSKLGHGGSGGFGNGYAGGSEGGGGANSGAGGGGQAVYNQNPAVGGSGGQAGIVIVKYLKSVAGE
jgi:hypothetical protein